MDKSKLLKVLEITQLNLVSSYPVTNTPSLDIFDTGIELLSQDVEGQQD